MINENIFRAYDIRGKADEDLNDDIIRKIGIVLSEKILKTGQNKVYLGTDCRLSANRIKKSLISGLCSNDLEVLDLGMVPTPLVYFATKIGKTNCGIMITGSHNPKEDNGLKMVINDGAVSGFEIKNDVINLKNKMTNIVNISDARDLIEQYENEIFSNCKLQKKIKVVLDSGNGAAGPYAKKVFEKIGAEIISLNTEPDGNFPNHHPDPSKEKNLKDLIESVSVNQADLGFAFDGDGDRVGMVDNNSNVVSPDHIIMLLSEYFLQKKKGPVIYDVKCSNQVSKIIEDNGGDPIIEKTGHFNIKNKIRETNAILGAEMSGHIFINYDWYGFDDGIYSAVILTKIISELEIDLSTKISDFPKVFSTPELTLDVEDSQKFEMVDKFKNEVDFSGYEILDIDGVRFSNSKAWGLLRASNTSPKLVMRFEGDTDQELIKIIAFFKDNFKKIYPNLNFEDHN